MFIRKFKHVYAFLDYWKEKQFLSNHPMNVHEGRAKVFRPKIICSSLEVNEITVVSYLYAFLDYWKALKI